MVVFEHRRYQLTVDEETGACQLGPWTLSLDKSDSSGAACRQLFAAFLPSGLLRLWCDVTGANACLMHSFCTPFKSLVAVARMF